MKTQETAAAPTEQMKDIDISASRERIPFPAVLVIYSILFYVAWTLFEFVGKPYLAGLGLDPVVEQLIKSGVVKNLVWTLPALLLIKKYEYRMQIPLKTLFTSKVDPKLTLALFAVLPLFTVLPKLIRNHSLSINPEFTVCTAIGFLFVGITEESVFRGWLLNSTLGKTENSMIFAYALNAVMFTLIHIPTWTTHDQLGVAFGKLGFLTIMLVGFALGQFMIRTKNLMLPVVMHMYYDVLLELFI